MKLLRRCWPKWQAPAVSSSLLLLLIVYSFSSQFLPIEPYLVPYFTSVKHFSNSQITLDVYPISVYSQLVFTLLMIPACLYLSHKLVILLGAFGMLLTYGIIWAGQSLLSMQLMQEWLKILRRAWRGKEIKVLSFWWAAAYAGLNLMQNYSNNLFDAVDPQSKWNGHVLAASQAAGSFGSLCAIYLEKFSAHSGLIFYILGSAIMSLFCIFMGTTRNLFLAYFSYIFSSGIYWCLACLVYARCGQLMASRDFILLFSLNNFAGLLAQTLLQVVLEIARLSIFAQYISFAGFFTLASAILIGCCCITKCNDMWEYYEGETA